MDPLSGSSLDLTCVCYGDLILLLFVVDPLYGASLDISREYLGKQILSLFSMDPLCAASLDLSWECFGKQILSLFAVDLLWTLATVFWNLPCPGKQDFGLGSRGRQNWLQEFRSSIF